MIDFIARKRERRRLKNNARLYLKQPRLGIVAVYFQNIQGCIVLEVMEKDGAKFDLSKGLAHKWWIRCGQISSN